MGEWTASTHITNSWWKGPPSGSQPTVELERRTVCLLMHKQGPHRAASVPPSPRPKSRLQRASWPSPQPAEVLRGHWAQCLSQAAVPMVTQVPLWASFPCIGFLLELFGDWLISIEPVFWTKDLWTRVLCPLLIQQTHPLL